MKKTNQQLYVYMYEMEISLPNYKTLQVSYCWWICVKACVCAESFCLHRRRRIICVFPYNIWWFLFVYLLNGFLNVPLFNATSNSVHRLKKKKRKKWMAIRTSRPHVWIMCLSCYWCLLFRHKHNFVQQYLRSGLDGDRRARPPRNTHSQLTLSRVCDCVPVGIIIWHN